MRARATATLVLASALALAAPARASTSPATAPDRRAACVAQLNKDLDTGERIGQLIWVGLNESEAPYGVNHVVTQNKLGGVVLLGGFHDGRASIQSTTRRLAALAGPRVGLAIAADQEGGYVQQLQGSGFSTMPTAFTQGRTYSQATLLAQNTAWARQVAAAGVNVNLAPVADTVALDFMPRNGPIGRYQRNYDYVADRVATDVATVVTAMHAGGVAATVKHFPGLGRITGNTDTTATGITDTSTDARSAYLRPFAAGIGAGADFVMVSSAFYPRIDPDRQAVFSTPVITGLLRGQLGYDGVVITDDVGNAAAVQSTAVGNRATRFIDAGGDIVLTAKRDNVATMIKAIKAGRTANPAFKARLDAAVLRVLTLKTVRGLTSCS